jgi:MoxR-like ATPase
MPAYVQERTTYDLSMLLDPEKMQGMAGWKSANPVKEVRLRDEESLAAATAFLRQHSMLDEAQLQAIMAALTQELVLIQGPPGTGKS